MTTVSYELTWPVTDEAVRHYVEELLKMRWRAEAGDPPGLREANIAAFLLSELARGLLGWASGPLGLKLPSEEYTKLTVNEQRSQIARALELGVPVPQPEARFALLDALEGLNAGEVAPLLARNGGRRGEAPELSAKAKLGVLKLIRWQRGLGRTVEDAQEAAAEELGITSSAIKQWPKELEKVFGEERVASELALAEKVGRWEAEGKTIRDLRPRESDDDQRLWEAFISLPRDLKELADMRRRAMERRGIK